MPAATGSAIAERQLIGRAREVAAVDALLQAARLGMSGALVLRGEAGIGKTALLDHAIGCAGEFRVVRAIGIESEMNVGFAGLHQLLVAFLPHLERVPPPQRNALGVAFGLAAGPTPERFQVALATLTLLATTAEEKPLLCVVDDAQWLDVESAEVLTFVARRLHAENVALLFALRDPLGRPISFAGIQELRLAPLGNEDACRLLRSVNRTALDEEAARRLIDETGGNPLAILELSAEPIRGWLTSAPAIAEPLPIGERLQQHFMRQVEQLSSQGQAFLRLASAETSLDPVVLWRAATRLGFGRDAFAEAEAKHLIIAGPPMSFRHPLIRSAVYYGMPAEQRRRVHAALAVATDPKFEPDRHAAHLALATLEPDEAVAAELAERAEGAQRSGAYAAWAAFASRAAELTADSELKASRLLAASRAWMAAGRPDRAQASLNDAMPALIDPFQRALAHALGGRIHFASGQASDGPAMLLEAARAMASLDAQRSRRILLNALEAAAFSRPARTDAVMCEIAAEVLGSASTSPRQQIDSAAESILRGYATLIMSGYQAAAPILKEGIARTRREGADPEALQSLPTLAAYSLFDADSAHALSADWVRVARERAALTALAVALQFLALAELYFGHLDDADALRGQSLEIAEATGSPGFLGSSSRGDVLFMAWRGHEAQARERAAAHVAEAQARGEPFWANFAGFGLTVLDLALGRYEAAFQDALPTYKDDPPYAGSWVLPNLIEAAARIGKEEIATAALGRLSERATAGGTALGLGLLARSRALLAEDAQAEPLYREAIDLLVSSPTRPELGRAHLLYGEWLRRQNRRRDSREQLRTAYEMFSSMGISAFAERARVELLATGERVRRRTIEAQDQLSAQELQVARLAAQGLRNQEIASQLFITERTVEYHLAKVFRKLDVTSRTQLAHAPQVVGTNPHQQRPDTVPR